MIFLAVPWLPAGRTEEGAAPTHARAPLFTPEPEVRPTAPAFAPLTGPKLRSALAAPLPALQFERTPARQILRSLAEGNGVAVWHDRRVDPSVRVSLAFGTTTLGEAFTAVAAECGANVAVVGNAVAIGPEVALRDAVTLAEVRRLELSRPGGNPARTIAVQRGRTIRWGDLTTSAELLSEIAGEFGLAVTNPELLPPDQLERGLFADMPAAEMLSLFFIQYGLTFAWSADRAAIVLSPLPDRQTEPLVRPYTLAGNDAEALTRWRAGHPDAKVTLAGRKATVTAPLAAHAELAGRLSPPETALPPAADVAAAPLARREFTLTVSNVPASAIMEKLGDGGVRFDYDPVALAAAGIDLDAPVTLAATRSPAAKFFRDLFEPLGLTTELQGTTVKLRPSR